MEIEGAAGGRLTFVSHLYGLSFFQNVFTQNILKSVFFNVPIRKKMLQTLNHKKVDDPYAILLVSCLTGMQTQ